MAYNVFDWIEDGEARKLLKKDAMEYYKTVTIPYLLNKDIAGRLRDYEVNGQWDYFIQSIMAEPDTAFSEVQVPDSLVHFTEVYMEIISDGEFIDRLGELLMAWMEDCFDEYKKQHIAHYGENDNRFGEADEEVDEEEVWSDDE